MPRAIVFQNAAITRVSSRLDKGCSFGVTTGEMKPEETAILLGLHGINVKILLEPLEDPDDTAPAEVKSEKVVKGLSQRLYDVLYVYFKQEAPPEDFESFRKTQMEKIINHFKSKLDPM